jgi:hypothetical protein
MWGATFSSKPLDHNAGSLVTAPPSASPASSLPSSPVQVAAPKSAPALAASTPAQQEQRAGPVAASKFDDASNLSPLRIAFLAFAGLLTLGTVVRMVIS